MSHRKAITALVAIGALVTAGTAGAVTSNTFGFGGSQPVLTPSCAHGAYDFTSLPTRKAMAAGFAVSQGTLQCEHRRVSRMIGCAKKYEDLPVVVEKKDHGAGKPGDESGAAAVRDQVAAYLGCVANVTGVK